MYITPAKTFVFLILSIVVVLNAVAVEQFRVYEDPPPRIHYAMHIISNLPKNSPKLRIHCAAGDDELGYHDLYPGEDFSWRITPNSWGTTLYFCHFWWNGKDVRFDVFTPKGPPDWCAKGWVNYPDDLVRAYTVKEDGFYLGCDLPPADVQYVHDWNQ